LKEKLTSRKLWLAVTNFVVMIAVSVGMHYESVTQIAALIMAGGGIIAYVLGEAWCDSKKGDNDGKTTYF